MKANKLKLLMVAPLIFPAIAVTAIVATSCSTNDTAKYEITYESNRATTISRDSNVPLTLSASINKTKDTSASWLYCFMNTRTLEWYTNDYGKFLTGYQLRNFAIVNDEIEAIIVYVSGDYLDKLQNQVVKTETWKVVD